MKKKIILLGATGSIGSQTLDVLRQHPDDFELVGVSCGSREAELKKIADEFKTIKAVSVPVHNAEITWDIPVYTGDEHMKHLLENTEHDLLVNATVGFRGLLPTLTDIEQGIDVALANKESLVAGGPLVKKALAKSKARLFPIDSEHSAIWQCLKGNDSRTVKRLIITASGGSFRDKGRDELKDVTPAQALKHPNWNMGKRITIDSATMVNKGFEVIEAHYLFDVPFDRIDTVLHAQSIVHSMVEYEDNAVMAQLGSADMRLPIQYAIFNTERPKLTEDHPLDMAKTLTLDFKEMDFERFPMLKRAYEVGKRGGNAGAVFNGADEEAVKLFLEGKIGFLQIEDAINYALDKVEFIADPTYEDLRESDKLARLAARGGVETGYRVE